MGLAPVLIVPEVVSAAAEVTPLVFSVFLVTCWFVVISDDVVIDAAVCAGFVVISVCGVVVVVFVVVFLIVGVVFVVVVGVLLPSFT